jgi:hypothetical protein
MSTLFKLGVMLRLSKHAGKGLTLTLRESQGDTALIFEINQF